MRSRVRLLVLGLGLPAALAGRATAQVGTGWVQYDPPSQIHLDGPNGIQTYPGTSTKLENEGATFTNQGGVETFALFDPISNRAERRIQNTYLTGRRQFEGEVRVSPPTNDESVMQIFGGNSGATTQMIRAYDDGGGTLRKVPGSVVVASNIHGVWLKLNVIHDVEGNFVKTYLAGKLISTGDGEATNAGTDGWYHKYGCYGTLRTGSAKVEWRNVKHFRDGTPPAGDAPPPSDAGAPPAQPDAAAPADAPSPSDAGDLEPDAADLEPDAMTPQARRDASAPPASGGTGGPLGGSGGRGGASGGESGSDEPDPGQTSDPRPSRKTSQGCDYGGGGGGGAFCLLLLLGLARRRRV
jgi:hypothetical protein